jgi:hypothetical protein
MLVRLPTLRQDEHGAWIVWEAMGHEEPELGGPVFAMSHPEVIFVVEESPEGGFEARALGHSIFTAADSLPELRIMVQDAVLAHFEENERPKIVRLHFVRDEVLAV